MADELAQAEQAETLAAREAEAEAERAEKAAARKEVAEEVTSAVSSC